MSKHKEQKKESTKSWKRIFLSKKFIIIAVVVILLFVVGFAASWFYMQDKQISEEEKKQQLVELIDQTVIDAQTLTRSGDSAGAVAKYDETINTISDSYQKSILTINKAIIFLNKQDYETALTIAKEAEAINVNFGVVKIIAQIYEEKGDKPNAIIYYKKTIELIDKNDPMATDDAIYYQSVIDSLNGVVSNDTDE